MLCFPYNPPLMLWSAHVCRRRRRSSSSCAFTGVGSPNTWSCSGCFWGRSLLWWWWLMWPALLVAPCSIVWFQASFIYWLLIFWSHRFNVSCRCNIIIRLMKSAAYDAMLLFMDPYWATIQFTCTNLLFNTATALVEFPKQHTILLTEPTF